MCALIAMCCHDTEENGRTEYTRHTLEGLRKTVNWDKHRLVIIDNGSCEATKHVIGNCGIECTVVVLSENIGTARGINYAIRLRSPGEAVCKIDNDCLIGTTGWLDELQEAADRDERIGIVGLKRVDLWERPDNPDESFRSRLFMLPHEAGQRWIIGESVQHIIGTCTLLTTRWLDKCGGMFQVKKYGLDDYDASARCIAAGMLNVFLPHIPIEHLDVGGTEYCNWKEREAGEGWDMAREIVQGYMDGSRPLYVNI